jgi:hypothetical protein
MELWKRLLKATVLAATLALILEIVTVGAYVAVGQPSNWANPLGIAKVVAALLLFVGFAYRAAAPVAARRRIALAAVVGVTGFAVSLVPILTLGYLAHFFAFGGRE